MKLVKYFLIYILSAAILVNCGKNESKRATTPTDPTLPVTCFDSNSCDPTVPTHIEPRFYISNQLQVTNGDLYDDFLKSVYGTCDIPRIHLSPSLIETLIISGILSAGTRCSKWNDRASVQLTVNSNLQAQFNYTLHSSYLGGSFSNSIINQHITFLPINQNTGYEADLNTHFNYQKGVQVRLEGDFNSNRITLYLVYFGDEIAKFELMRVQ